MTFINIIHTQSLHKLHSIGNSQCALEIISYDLYKLKQIDAANNHQVERQIEHIFSS